MSVLDLEELLAKIPQLIARLTRFSAFSVYLLDEPRQELRVAYAGAAFARVGPDERYTRGIASAARVAEPWIGAAVLAPAAFDMARYYKPEIRWLRWASRASKVAGALLVLRAAD